MREGDELLRPIPADLAAASGPAGRMALADPGYGSAASGRSIRVSHYRSFNDTRGARLDINLINALAASISALAACGSSYFAARVIRDNREARQLELEAARPYFTFTDFGLRRPVVAKALSTETDVLDPRVARIEGLMAKTAALPRRRADRVQALTTMPAVSTVTCCGERGSPIETCETSTEPTARCGLGCQHPPHVLVRFRRDRPLHSSWAVRQPQFVGASPASQR